MSIGLTVGGWFASAFLQTLVDKATSYTLQQLGQRSDLHGEVRQLGRSLVRARTVLRIVERKQQRNKDDEEQLRDLLLQLKDAAYDAEDFFGDLDYEILRRKVAEQNEASHDIFSSSISFAANFFNSGDDDFAAKAHVVRQRLDDASNDTEKIILLLNLEESGRQHEMPARKRESSSLPTEPRMIGRDEEKEDLIRLLLSTADVSGSSTADRNVPVLPVVGMGGLGKTTLAKFVYQDSRVQNYFQLKMWVCVSNEPFDVKRLTRMILESPAKKELSNLSSLQEHLKKKVSSKRYLLVLDDVWNEDRKEWESLFAPLRYGLQGSMIMVTTRSKTVVRAMTGTLDPIFLKGLPEVDYMEFFKACAFGSENPKDRPEMEEIAERIAAKLKGSPLAAKTLGGSLNSNMDVGHWRNIMNSEIWQLQQDENDIMPVLELSYQHLPLHLKPCFSICSIYPQDYYFEAKELVYLWMAQGFLVAPRPNMRLEDVGIGYFLDLTSRSFFQRDASFQIQELMGEGCSGIPIFQIHDLMHDLAKYVSKDDCFSIPNDGQEIPSSIRHLSIICTENLDLHEVMDSSDYNFNKLRSLLIFNYSKPELNLAIVRWFDRLQYIRVLYSKSRYDISEFPESIGNLKHLQFLKTSGNGFSTFRESFCRLYSLKYLDIICLDFPRGFANLINLRRFEADDSIGCKITDIGKLTNLQYLDKFDVQKEHGHGIDELKNLKQLHGDLWISNLEKVESREEACQANLGDKEYLDGLSLEWAHDRNTSIAGSIGFSGDIEVLEGLKPHRNLKTLGIIGYGGDKLPSWLQTQTFPCLSARILGGEGSVDQGIYSRGSNSIRSSALSELELSGCRNLKCLPGLHHMPALKKLDILFCPELRSIGGLDALTSLEYLYILECPKLTDLESLPSEREVQRKDEFISNWTIDKTVLLKQPFAHILSSFHLNLSIHRSRESVWFDEGDDQEWLQILTSLRNLTINGCPNLRSLPTWLHRLTSLQYLTIRDCPAIESLPENGLPTSLTEIFIDDEQLEEKHRALLDTLSLR